MLSLCLLSLSQWPHYSVLNHATVRKNKPFNRAMCAGVGYMYAYLPGNDVMHRLKSYEELTEKLTEFSYTPMSRSVDCKLRCSKHVTHRLWTIDD